MYTQIPYYYNLFEFYAIPSMIVVKIVKEHTIAKYLDEEQTQASLMLLNTLQ